MNQYVQKNTKIIATVGPACSSYENLLALAREGVNIFRLNFSHGTHEDHQKVINNVNYINEKYNMHLGLLADLQGPKLRVGKIKDNALELNAGDIVTFSNKKTLGTLKNVYMSYDRFAKDVKVGERVLIDDGKLVFEVVSTDGKSKVKLKTLFGGTLSSNKGVNLPNTKISLPCLTEKDLVDLEFILTQPVHWIALSFVRTGKDLKDLRKRIDAVNHPAKIIAKVEKPEAIKNLDKIIKNSNAVMVARGDLGVEVPMERLPLLQKEIVRKCRQRARPVIVATQMMDSMITSPSPTRAEITDVANAVLDGTDAVMLSGETSVGKHPVVVVKAMVKIINEAEAVFDISGRRPAPAKQSRTYYSDVACFMSARAANEVDAKAIVGMTSSGYTAFKVSSFRPDSKIYVFSDKIHMLSTLSLVWGVRTFYYDKFTTTDETVEDVNNILKQEGLVKKGDVVINIGSMPLHRRFRTNMMRMTLIE